MKIHVVETIDRWCFNIIVNALVCFSKLCLSCWQSAARSSGIREWEWFDGSKGVFDEISWVLNGCNSISMNFPVQLKWLSWTAKVIWHRMCGLFEIKGWLAIYFALYKKQFTFPSLTSSAVLFFPVRLPNLSFVDAHFLSITPYHGQSLPRLS